MSGRETGKGGPRGEGRASQINKQTPKQRERGGAGEMLEPSTRPVCGPATGGVSNVRVKEFEQEMAAAYILL